MTNKKVLNATLVEVDGIQMKSKIEKTIYLALKELGITPQYEGETFVYWTERKPKTFFYDRNSKRQLRLNMQKLRNMKYTPDFVFTYQGIKVIIEVKGWENDAFPIRKKLFRGYLDTLPYPVVYAEIFTRKQLLEFMGVLQEKAPEIINQKKNMLVKRKRNPCNAVFFDGTNWEEVYALFTPTGNVPSAEAINESIASDNAFYVNDRVFGEISIIKDHWIVKDTVTEIVFQLTDAEFQERYDIVTE